MRARGNDGESCGNDGECCGNDGKCCADDDKDCENDRVRARKNDGRFCRGLQQAKFIDV